MNLGKNILELRKQKNVTQEELASELGVTAAAVSKWENNYTLPDILMLCALADYFDTTTDALLGRPQQKRYAIVAAETEELGDAIALMASKAGLTVREIYESFEEAKTAAAKQNDLCCLFAGYHHGEYTTDIKGLPLLVSVAQDDLALLGGIARCIERYLN